jgi:hypothetical protein
MNDDAGRWAARAPALYAAGRLADLHGDRDWAHGLYAQCLPLFQELGDSNRLAYTLHWLS